MIKVIAPDNYKTKERLCKESEKRHFLNKNRYPAVEYRGFSLLICRYHDPWWLDSVCICGYGRIGRYRPFSVAFPLDDGAPIPIVFFRIVPL
jgi:hypothetical protein